jgi:tRNA(Ile)-lysidine synthase
VNRSDFRIRALFRHAIRRAGVPDGATLLVAVSGGADSTALLRLCHDEAGTRGWEIVVGHIDHGLREGSAADAEGVRRLAGALGLPCSVLRVAERRRSEAAGRSLEDEARRWRRRGLRRLARRARADWILLGHTRDDQAETVLLQLLRGSGLRGLSGMDAIRHPWLRPLLEVPRSELRGFLRRAGWSWREDPTNDDPRFLRNRVRARLLPLLRAEFQPGIDAVLARTAGSLREARRFLRRAAAEAWREGCLEEAPGRIRLDRPRLRSYHPAVLEEVLRQACVRLRGTSRDLAQAHLVTLYRLVRSERGGTWRLPGDMEASLDRREIRLTHPRQGSGEETGPARLGDT